MAITDWPRSERPREKLLQQGASSLSDAEILAIFIRCGLAGKSAVDVARDALTRSGGLRNLLTMSPSDLGDYRGIGLAKFVEFQAALELGRRYITERLQRGSALESPLQTRQLLALQLRDRPYEVFCALFLDNQHRMLKFSELFRGTLNSASVHPREVVVEALKHNAAALIIAHNHPSGIAEPSTADRQITSKLRDALGLVDIRLLDHFIVGDGEMASFAERGWL
jgi:DNA repair protein RadC